MRQVDLRPRQSAIIDQGMRPTCLACAATSGHEYLRGDGHRLSVEYLNWTCLRIDGAYRQGLTMDSTIRALTEVGQPYEELWPYEPTIYDLAPDYSPPSEISQDDCFKVRWGNGVRPIVEDLKWNIRVGRVVLVGLRIYYSFHTSSDGKIPIPEATESPCGRHVVLLVGYNDDERQFIFKNSWGDNWGTDGYGFLPYSYLEGRTLAACIFSNDMGEVAWEN